MVKGGANHAYGPCIDYDDFAREAADRRAVVQQATGMLMERHGCDVDEAFDILLDLSGRESAGVYAIAALMLQRHGL